MKQTAAEWLFEKLWNTDKDKFTWYAILKKAKEMEKQQQGYSEEDMGIIEISSIEANYIPHYQTKEGQFLATKFNVKQFKNK